MFVFNVDESLSFDILVFTRATALYTLLFL